MLEQQLAKIVTMAAMTELDQEVAQHALSPESLDAQNRHLIRAALKKRYERDPHFHDSLQKLALSVRKQAVNEQRSVEQVFDHEVAVFQENQQLSDLIVADQQQKQQQQVVLEPQYQTSQALLNSIAEEPIDSLAKNSQNGQWDNSPSEFEQSENLEMNQPLITVTRGDGKTSSAKPLLASANLDNSFDKPAAGSGMASPSRQDLDQMESSELFKASQDSFAQFAASGEFCFDTQRCDFTELKSQMAKEGAKALDKFDFQLLIQTQENIDEYPATFSSFIAQALEDTGAEKIAVVLKRSAKALLQSYPGLYRDLIKKLLLVLEGKPDILQASYSELVELELQFYLIVHPLQPKDDSYNSPLLSRLIQNGLLLQDKSGNIKLLQKAFLRRQTRMILIRALESTSVLQSIVDRLEDSDSDQCTAVELCLFHQVVLYRVMFSAESLEAVKQCFNGAQSSNLRSQLADWSGLTYQLHRFI